MMILFNGHGLTPKERFTPEAFGLQLSERQSTATLTLSPSAPVLSVDDWVMAEDGPGARIVWRVKTVDDQVEKQTRTVQLEHVINSLRDRIMFGEITTKMISGNKNTATARQTVEYILANQSDWQLGDFAYSVSNPYAFNGDDLFSALETVSGSLKDCIWEYDFSSYPFTLHIRQLADGVGSELRMDRNVRTLKKTIDRSRMYTRFYPIGKNNLKIDGEYVSKNENLYGVISHVETDQSQDTKDKLKAWAQERLDRHCEPFVTVTVSGLDLSEATGEALDSFTIGRKCQIPLPELSDSITERVTKLSYPDVVKDPENVTITLANELMDVATILKQQSAGGNKAGRYGARNSEEDHAWIVDNNEKVELVAEAVAGKDGDGANWSRVATLTVDGKGIDARVVKAEGEIVTQASRITQTETSIQQEVVDRTAKDKELSGQITVEAGKITQIVRAVGKDGEVTAASIVLAINQSTGESEAKIDAQRVYIGNEKSTTVINGKCSLSDVTASYIGSKIASLAQVSMQEAAILTAGITTLRASNMYFTSQEQGHSVYTSVKNAFAAMQLVQDGDIYTLQYKSFADSEWQDIGSFERAASVETTLSGSWSGTTYTVTAIPQGNRESTSVYLAIEVGGYSVAPNTKINAKIYKDNPSVSGNQLTVTEMELEEDVSNKKVKLTTENGTITKGEISTQATYEAGQNSVGISGSWSNTTYTARTSVGQTTSTTVIQQVEGAANPNATVYAKIYKDSTAAANQLASTEMTLSEDVANRVVKLTTQNGVITKGQISTEATYTAGWNAVKLSGSWSGTTYTVSKKSTGGNSASTRVYLQIDVGGTSVSPNAKVLAKIYKDSITSANQIASTEMTLSEDVANRKVNLTTGGGAVTKGQISTQATYQAGISAYYHSALWGIDASSNVYIPTEANPTGSHETWFNILTVTENGGYILKSSGGISGVGFGNTGGLDWPNGSSIGYDYDGSYWPGTSTPKGHYVIGEVIAYGKDGTSASVVARLYCQGLYDAGKTEGYNANHSMFIGDTNSNPVTTYTLPLGGSVDLWPGFKKTDNTYQWGTKVTISGGGVRRTVTCTSKTFTQSQWKYTFEYWNSSEIFSANTNYTFYDKSR